MISRFKKEDMKLQKHHFIKEEKPILQDYLKCKSWCDECTAFDWSYCKNKYDKESFNEAFKEWERKHVDSRRKD